MREIFWEAWVDDDEQTIDIEQAQPFLTGYIDDNGTSEIRFQTQPVFIQNRAYAASLGKLLDRRYDIAKELPPDFHERIDEARQRRACKSAEQEAEEEG